MSAMQDPKIAQILQMNPAAPQMQAAMMAHINEHLGYEYRRQIEEMIGVPVPFSEDEDDKLDPEIELQISRLAADASAKLLNQNKTEIAAQQAQQAAQDPIVQMQQKELALKERDIVVKEKKLQIEAAAKADQLEIEQERIAAQERIAGMQVGAKVEKDRKDLAARQELEGVKIGSDIARAKAEMELREKQSVVQHIQHTENLNRPNKTNKKGE